MYQYNNVVPINFDVWFLEKSILDDCTSFLTHCLVFALTNLLLLTHDESLETYAGFLFITKD